MRLDMTDFRKFTSDTKINIDRHLDNSFMLPNQCERFK